MAPLTLERIEEIRSNAFADDVEFEYETMQHWTESHVAAWFENGGCEPTAPPDPILEGNVADSISSDDVSDDDDDDDDDDDFDYYDVLELPREAAADAVKKAYRKLAIKVTEMPHRPCLPAL